MSSSLKSVVSKVLFVVTALAIGLSIPVAGAVVTGNNVQRYYKDGSNGYDRESMIAGSNSGSIDPLVTDGSGHLSTVSTTASHFYPGGVVTLSASSATQICASRALRRKVILQIDPSGAFPNVAVWIGHDNTETANVGLVFYGDTPSGPTYSIDTTDAVWGYSTSAVPVAFAEVSD